MSDSIIKVEHLTKIYKLYDDPVDRLKEALHWRGKKYHKDFYALNDISFEIKKGECVGIIGKNGSGKSTLLKLITGVLTPTSGKVTVNGKVAALLELGAGFNPEYTGIENIYFQGSLMGYTKEEINTKVDSILAFADIGEFVYQPVKTYSSGMFARLAFAVAINVEPDILIVDEALSVGDAYFQQKCMNFMRKFRDNGGMLLFVSHDMGAVVSLCQKILWINDGMKIFDGLAKDGAELYLKDYYEKIQGATPEDNKNKVIADTKSIPQFIADERYEVLDNKIHVFEFIEDNTKNFGMNGAKIINVAFYDKLKHKINYLHGGELLKLEITIQANKIIHNPIIGFSIKDRLGQNLFGDNTYLTFINKPLIFDEGVQYICEFEFQMPLLPKGIYSVNVAIAEGTQESHIQHHWLNDALIIESINSLVAQGLVGIPMLNISIKRSK